MSVPAWKRNKNSDNTLDLFMESLSFAIYILKITKNQKIFLPIFQTSITDRLNLLAIDIHTNLWKANNTKLDDKNKDERYRLLRLAIQNCIDFLSIWDIAMKAFHLRSNRVEYVVGHVLNIRETTLKWINSDIKRIQNN